MVNEDYIIENFLGMNLSDQIRILDLFSETCEKRGIIQITKGFHKVFDEYYDTLLVFLSHKDLFQNFNSMQKRNIRDYAFQRLEEKIESHHGGNRSNEVEKERFIHYFLPDYFTREELQNELKQYYHPESISSDEVNAFIQRFTQYDDIDKSDVIEYLYFAFNKISFFHFPHPESVIEEYDGVMKQVYGEDLYPCYQRLYPIEKYELLSSFVYRLINVSQLDNQALVIQDETALRDKKEKILNYVCNLEDK